jgi:hypothetical protein
MKRARVSAITAELDEWTRRAIAASIARAKDLVAPQGPIPSATQLGKLSDSEWGWIASTVIWGWVATRAEQAASEGLDPERAVRVTKLSPCPWDAGAVRTILPQLAKSCAGFDWSRAASAWSKDELAEFLLTASSNVTRTESRKNIGTETARGRKRVCAGRSNART